MSDKNAETRTNRTGTRPLLLGAMVAAALVASMTALAGPASAAVPGLVTVAASTATNSVSPKSVAVTCPAGLELVSTGAEINGGAGEVVLDDLRPNGGPFVAPTSVFVTAYEEDVYGGNWSVRGYAVCANAGLGLVRIAASTAFASPDYAGATAVCPAGKALVGTGAEITGGVGQIVLDDLRPNGSALAAPDRVLAGAYDADPDYVPNWSITSYAICANRALLPGLSRIAAISAAGVSPDSAFATANCPAGKKRIGMGADVNGGFGEIVIDDLRTPSGTATGYEADPIYTPNWTITSFAICVNV